MTRYIDTAEQAVMMRKTLKRAFPAVKFSVRISQYSGGSTVYVRWVDGPTEKSVAEVANMYDGRRFDGMIDLAYSAEHYLLPDGSVEFARTYGHSQESEPPRPKPEGAETVHFAGSVSLRREISSQFEMELVGELAAVTDTPPDNFFTEYAANGSRYMRHELRVKAFVDEDGKVWPLSNGEDYANILVRQMAHRRAGKPRQATHASDPKIEAAS